MSAAAGTGLRVALALAVLLTAAPARGGPARVAVIYAGGESTGPFEIRRALAEEAIDLTVFAPGRTGEPLHDDTRLDGFDVVFVDGSTPGLGTHAAQVAAARATTRVVVVNPTAALTGNVDLAAHPDLPAYWSSPSQDNYRHLGRYLVARVLGHRDAPAPAPPAVYPAQAFYHPDAPALFATLEAYEDWARTRRPSLPADARTIGGLFAQSSYLQRNVAHVDALVRAIERRGHRPLFLAYRGGADLTRFMREDQPVIDVLLQVGSVFASRDRAEGQRRLARLGVPVLGAFSHHGQSEAQYVASPTGLLPTLGSAVVEAEMEGRIEPLPVAGRGAERGDQYFTAAFDASVQWRVDRAIGWARLRHLANARKRLLFTYWSQGGGKANVGGDPDDFLDVPATLVRLLGHLQARGYDVGPGPLPDRDTLVRRMSREASNVGSWAPGELAARVARGEVQLIDEQEYLSWFESLPAARRREIVEMWGPPPGKVLVHTDARGRRALVVPALVFGNVVVAPNPDWGYLQDAKALMSVGALPPHHQYLAFFLWMQKTWRTDAWVSLFSNMSLQGGKPVGPLPDDHIGVLLGAVPHIHPERLGANGGLKNKRKALAQTVSWYNIVRPSGTESQHFTLRALLQRYPTLDPEALRAEGERLIRDEVRRSGIGRVLGDADDRPIDDLLVAVQRELNTLDRTFVPSGSKVLGDSADGDALVDMVTAMLGAPYTGALAARATTTPTIARDLVGDVVLRDVAPDDAMRTRLGSVADEMRTHLVAAQTYAAGLRAGRREIEGILEALDGRWIPPGSMDDPVRRPQSLPPGRSVYNFDSAEVPTLEAEALGIRQAEALIAAHRRTHGEAYPTSLAFAIFSGEIARNRGVTEAQILHLLGTRAVRDARGVVTGVALIPRETLGRPRVDVLLTTSGTYRDHYPDVMELIAQATRLAAASDEADNPVRAAVEKAEAGLRASGASAERAATLARARVFAPAPGAYSPSIQFLAKSGDQRGDERKMAELYTSRLSHAYGAGLYGESARPAFETQLARVDGASLSRTSSVNGMLDHPMSAGFLGGLNLAAKAVTGKDIDLYVSNLRDEARPTVETAAAEIQRELRTRYLNPSWVAEMQSHGYEGARTFMYGTDHLDLWDTTATGTVTSADWQEIKQVYVDDSLDLGLDAFFDRFNPHAQQVLLSNLLGAAARGHWEATTADKAQVASRLARSTAAHGIACEANMCRNPALTRLVETALAGSPDGEALAAGYRSALATATQPVPSTQTQAPGAATPNRAGASAPGAPRTGASSAPARTATPATTPAEAARTITGQVMERVEQGSAPHAVPRQSPAALAGLGLLALACVAVGWLRQTRL